MKSFEEIALEQRDYWLSVAKETGDMTFTQQKSGEPFLSEIIANAKPRDWAEAWNLHLPGDKRL